jgi:predicted ATPase
MRRTPRCWRRTGLGRGDGAALVRRLAGGGTVLPQDVVAEIVERTDGVPLLLEEMTKAVLEAGADRGHAVVSGLPSAALAVPTSLHASLMARLDRLGPEAKRTAQIGAAIGREFSHELIEAVAPLTESELRLALRLLVDAGLVFQRGSPPAALYLFKHALVRDIAYSTLLRGPRKPLHRRIASALEERFASLAESQPGQPANATTNVATPGVVATGISVHPATIC